ncbi:hypothetical protein SAMN05421796_101136 [Chryseobacterium piscicola]|uniref:Head domain of trimeric autotransporter adhesin n=1 Tax=Chryseobacterium piscicola TaxID=551459 RepID=A0A1N7JTS2_9FLAO|nr:hypothetical protein [Chryseobacterium piscicola]PQA91280.1 hypothetical protein B0A70_12460 [Chryseobacterium piscicola]SIS52759.1 hypothetical protein SAMN05421796_101136 [Chryseobacterium piscicola]
MRKITTTAFVLLAANLFYAQVGINTANPQATLDISGSGTNTTKGLLVPRLTATEILAMTQQNALGSQQNSLIVFATTTTPSGDFVTSKITQPGFYRYTYDGSNAFQQYWKRMEPSAFERIAQGGKTGIRLIDADIQKYGLIGSNAIDASFSNQTTSFHGATGDNSFAAGINTLSSGIASTAFGNDTEALGNGSFAGGQDTRSVGLNSFAYGENAEANNINSVAFGKTNYNLGINSSILAGRNNKITNSFNSAVLSGNNNTINYTGTSADDWPNNYNGVANNILGGHTNSITGSVSLTINTIVGGINNLINESRHSVIGGGGGNKIKPAVAPYDQPYYSSNIIAGGEGNEINADKSVIGGGDRNLIRLEGTAQYQQGAGMSTISGGQFNKTINDAHFSAVVGGRGNSTKGSYSIVGGASNVAQSVAEVSLGLFGTLYTPQYPNAYTFNGTWFNDLALSKDRLFNIGNGKAPSNFDFQGDVVTGSPLAVRSDAFTILKNGQVGIDIDNFETNTSTAKLQINGGIKLSANSTALSGNSCDNTNRGQIIFVEDNFYGCKSTGWALLNN